jgi:predicted alpha/beta-fold hydrolase
MSKRALIVIDVQNEYFDGALPITDPPADKAHPAAMTVIHIPTHGLLINGVVYSPTGAGPHPTIIICHGLPGNEKNLDLAQALRRAGWNAVTFNYRGSWGSPGNFRFAQNLEIRISKCRGCRPFR